MCALVKQGMDTSNKSRVENSWVGVSRLGVRVLSSGTNRLRDGDLQNMFHRFILKASI